MSTESVSITAEPREGKGTRSARRLRAEGKLPAVVYGHGEEPVNIALPAKETIRHLHDGAHLFDLTVDGKSQSVLLKDVQTNYLGDEIIHLDLFRVNLDEEVTSDVSLHLVGEAQGKDEGAVLTQTRDTITVICKVRDLPDEVKHDVSEMKIGDVLHVQDLSLPEGVKLPEGVNFTVATVAVPKRILKAQEEDAAEAEAGEPEIIGQDGDSKGDGADSDQNA